MYWRLAVDGDPWPSMQSRCALNLDKLYCCACGPCITVAEAVPSHVTVKAACACHVVVKLCETLWGASLHL